MCCSVSCIGCLATLLTRLKGIANNVINYALLVKWIHTGTNEYINSCTVINLCREESDGARRLRPTFGDELVADRLLIWQAASFSLGMFNHDVTACFASRRVL